MKFIIFYLIIILLLLYPVISFFQFLKERNRLRKKAIRNLEIRFSINLITSVVMVFFVLIILMVSGQIKDLYAYHKVALLSFFVLIILTDFFLKKIFKNILITDEGLFISKKLIKWADIETIEDNKYSIKIKTGVRFYKNRKINKIFYNITQDDVAMLKKLS